MTTFDGPTLRAVRESVGVPLRQVAKHSGMSHGHLSKVERGEYGRPVTPAILAAYQRASGVDLYQAAKAAIERSEGPTARRVRSWTPGEMTNMRRRVYNAGMAGLAIGGVLGEPFGRLLDAAGRPLSPVPPEPGDVEQLEAHTDTLICCDLRYGGSLVSQSGKHLLRWAVVMLDSVGMAGDTSRRLHTVVGVLAHRAGWAAFDTAAHEAARGLFRLALYAATRAGDANLRAHVLADAAAQHTALGYHDDALQLLRIAEGDERVAPVVRMVLHGVRARTYAALGDLEGCRRQVVMVEDTYVNTPPGGEGWLGRLRHEGYVGSVTGHAYAEAAAASSGNSDTLAKEACRRLAAAAEVYDPQVHGRAYALCMAQLARQQLHLPNGDLQQAAQWGQQAVRSAGKVRSARLDRALGTLRSLARLRAGTADEPAKDALGELVTAIETAVDLDGRDRS